MINLGLGTFKKSKEEIGSLYTQTRTSFLDAAHANFMNTWNLNPFSSFDFLNVPNPRLIILFYPN